MRGNRNPLIANGPTNPLFGQRAMITNSSSSNPGLLMGSSGPGGSPPHSKANEIHARPANQNCIERWLSRFPSRSKRIDVMSRLFFPTMFGAFNIVYWTTYSLRDDLND